VIEFLAANWLLVAAAIVFFVVMRRSGHGCSMHGSRAGHAGHQHTEQNRPTQRADADRGAT
jgi:hypothetical protein